MKIVTAGGTAGWNGGGTGGNDGGTWLEVEVAEPLMLGQEV